MNGVQIKRAKRKKILEATKGAIENIEAVSAEITTKATKRKRAKKIKPDEVKLVVPFNIASKINKDINIKNEYRNLRKKLLVYIQEHFDDFLDDYKRLECEPALRARIYVEIIKIALPRQRYEEGLDERSENERVMKRLFGKQEDKIAN